MLTILFIKKPIFLLLLLSVFLNISGCGLTENITKKYSANSEFNTLVVRGDAAMDCGDWTNAIAAYEDAAKIKPTDDELKLKLANAFERDGMITKASNLYQVILDAPQQSERVLIIAKARQAKLKFKSEQIASVNSPKTPSKVVSEKKVEKLQEAYKSDDLLIELAKEIKYSKAVEDKENLPITNTSTSDIKNQDNRTQTSSEVESFLNSWRDAWVSKSLDQYFDHYVLGFSGDNKNSAAWRAQRKLKIIGNKKIAVYLENVELISVSKDQVKVSFTQRYQADSYQDKGEKILILQKVDGRWRIIQETFRVK
jgi:tetratricopeptide (TPR) repeat protein